MLWHKSQTTKRLHRHLVERTFTWLRMEMAVRCNTCRCRHREWHLLAMVAVVVWIEASLCNGGQAADIASGLQQYKASNRAVASFLPGCPAGAQCAYIAAFAPTHSSVRGIPVDGRAVFCRPPKTLCRPAGTLWNIASAEVRICPLLSVVLPLQRGSETQLQSSLTISGIDNDEGNGSFSSLSARYQCADLDGTRIFFSGLAPNFDEYRLIRTLQSYPGVVEVKLGTAAWKKGGFALFKDPVSANVAFESLQNFKLNGKTLTVSRASTFNIQQQQQATSAASIPSTMHQAINQRIRSKAVQKYATEPQDRRRGKGGVDLTSWGGERGCGSKITSNSLRSLNNNPPPTRTPPVRSGGMGEVDRLFPKIRDEKKQIYRVTKEKENIRKQVFLEVKRQGDVKKSWRLRRVGRPPSGWGGVGKGENLYLPGLSPEEVAKMPP